MPNIESSRRPCSPPLSPEDSKKWHIDEHVRSWDTPADRKELKAVTACMRTLLDDGEPELAKQLCWDWLKANRTIAEVNPAIPEYIAYIECGYAADVACGDATSRWNELAELLRPEVNEKLFIDAKLAA